MSRTNLSNRRATGRFTQTTAHIARQRVQIANTHMFRSNLLHRLQLKTSLATLWPAGPLPLFGRPANNRAAILIQKQNCGMSKASSLPDAKTQVPIHELPRPTNAASTTTIFATVSRIRTQDSKTMGKRKVNGFPRARRCSNYFAARVFMRVSVRSE